MLVWLFLNLEKIVSMTELFPINVLLERLMMFVMILYISSLWPTVCLLNGKRKVLN